MDEERRRRFKAWFAQKYGVGPSARKKFMAESGEHGFPPYSKGRLTHLFDESEPFGEAAARSVALHVGLPENFFLVDRPGVNGPPVKPSQDFSDPRAPTASEWQMLEDLKFIPPDEREAIMKDLHEKAERNRALVAEVISRSKNK